MAVLESECRNFNPSRNLAEIASNTGPRKQRPQYPFVTRSSTTGPGNALCIAEILSTDAKLQEQTVHQFYNKSKLLS